ncbi:MAG: hypothetical protein H0T15_07510 [Thermoleophilaceae bacterium]|nr:hypothetical protein [Thermoleophilaceae bacterium]
MLRRLAVLTAALAVGISASAQAAPSIQSYPRPGVKDITEGPDGNVWITEGANVSRVVSGNPPTVTPFPSGIINPEEITTGPDGNLWYADAAALGRMTPAGTATPFPFAGIGLIGGVLIGADVRGLAAGPDGRLWVVDNGNDRVVRINTNGTAFPTATPLGLGNQARQITQGSDGNMYVAGDEKTARVTPAGVVTVIPNVGGGKQQDIAAGPDGNIWAGGTSFVNRLTPGGAFTNFAVPGTDTFGVAAGPDGAVWVAQFVPKTVARVAPDGTITPVGPTTLPPRYIARNSNTNEMWFAADLVGSEGIGVVRGIDIPVAPPAGGGAGAGGTPAVVPPDTVKPTIRSLRVNRTRKKVSLTLSEAARLTLTYERKVAGRRVKGRCKAGAKKGKRCSLYRRVATRTAVGRAGVNTFTIPSAARKAGTSNRLTATAIDAAGNLSLAAKTSYKVPAKKKKK